MEGIVNIEKDWDHVTAASIVEGPIKNVNREEMAIAIKKDYTRKGSWAL